MGSKIAAAGGRGFLRCHSSLVRVATLGVKEMEGNTVGAILEVPIITEGGAVENLNPPDSVNASSGVDLFAGIADETEAFYTEEGLADGQVPPSSANFHPAAFDSGSAVDPAQAQEVATSSKCRTDTQQEPPSPGEALLQEFNPLYRKYERRVYRQCYRMLGNQEDAEDMTQEVFLQLFRKAHTFRGESNFSTWLYRLTVNMVLMQLRRRRRWREAVTPLEMAPGSDEASSDVLTVASTRPAQATNMLDRIGLDNAIAQLSSGYREIFLLHDLEGYRHDEISKMLGISEGTSKSQLHKARNRMRALMG